LNTDEIRVVGHHPTAIVYQEVERPLLGHLGATGVETLIFKIAVIIKLIGQIYVNIFSRATLVLATNAPERNLDDFVIKKNNLDIHKT